MTSSDERYLIKRIAEGDQSSLEQLYARYRVRLWGYLWHRLDHNANLVEETLQEVFLGVWHAAKNYRGEAQVETWITRIAYNLALNAQRALKRRPEGYLVQQQEEQLQYNNSEDQLVERLAFREAMQQLSAKHRDVLEMVFCYGFSCEEVGLILCIPTGTVKSRISQARRQLASKINNERYVKGKSL